MTKLCIFVGVTVCGYAGWYLGELLGFEIMGAFLISGAGSIFGVYLGWKFAQRLDR